jgi:hypothetical protein
MREAKAIRGVPRRRIAGVVVTLAVLAVSAWAWQEYFPSGFYLDHDTMYYDVAPLVQAEAGGVAKFSSTTSLAAFLKEQLGSSGPNLVLGVTDRPTVIGYGRFLEQRRLRKAIETLEESP